MVIQKRKGFGPRTGILKYCQVDCPQMKSTDEVNDMFEKILKNWFLNSVRLIHGRAQDKQLSSAKSNQCREQVWYNMQPSVRISQTLINFDQSQFSWLFLEQSWLQCAQELCKGSCLPVRKSWISLIGGRKDGTYLKRQFHNVPHNRDIEYKSLIW